MTSKPVEVSVSNTEVSTLVEQKSKQTDIDNRPEPVSSPINNPAYTRLGITFPFLKLATEANKFHMKKKLEVSHEKEIG